MIPPERPADNADVRMRQLKISMIGTSGVGKTSLVSRFVHSIFSDRYLTTVGVHVSKKSVVVNGNEVSLIIWDLVGDDDFQRLNVSHLRSTAGYLLVADGTRAVTLDMAVEIQQRVASAIGPVPFVLAVNKTDLQSLWEVQDERIASLAAGGWTILKTSAKSGTEVDAAFGILAERVLDFES
jgi:small GTP-binding protein